MNRPDLIAALSAQAGALEARGARSLFPFGSAARDEAGPDSDVDLFIDCDRDRGFSLLDLIAMKQQLEDLLHQPVDLTTRDSLHPLLRGDIECSAVRVF